MIDAQNASMEQRIALAASCAPGGMGHQSRGIRSNRSLILVALTAAFASCGGYDRVEGATRTDEAKPNETKPAEEKPTDKQLIGKTVAEAIAATELQMEKHWVIEEPPGIGRGVQGLLPGGAQLRLYVRRGDVAFKSDGKWKLSEFEKLTVRGVARLEDGKWIVHGETMLTQPKR